MSATDRLDEVARLRERVERQLGSGATVPEGPAAARAVLRLAELTDEDGLIDALQQLGEHGDDEAAEMVEGLRYLGFDDAAEQLSTAWNWIEDGLSVDPEAGVKARDVVDALNERWDEGIDSETVELRIAERIEADPAAFGL